MRSWPAELREGHALEIGHRVTGLLRLALAHEHDGVAALEEHAARLLGSGLPATRGVALVDGDEARRREPELSQRRSRPRSSCRGKGRWTRACCCPRSAWPPSAWACAS
jgi:hypothetical protein